MKFYIVYVQPKLFVWTLNSFEQVERGVEPGEALFCLAFIVEKRSKFKDCLDLLGIVLQAFFIIPDGEIVALDLDVKPS